MIFVQSLFCYSDEFLILLLMQVLIASFLGSFVYTTTKVSLTLDIRQCLITGLVPGTVTILIDARGRRFEITWPVMIYLINTRPRMRRRCAITSPIGCVSGISCSLSSSVESICFVCRMIDSATDSGVCSSWLAVVVVELWVIYRLMMSMDRVSSWTSATSRTTASSNQVTWPHVWQNLWETLTIPGNSLTWISEG